MSGPHRIEGKFGTCDEYEAYAAEVVGELVAAGRSVVEEWDSVWASEHDEAIPWARWEKFRELLDGLGRLTREEAEGQ